MKFGKLALASSTALGLSMTGAFAETNDMELLQTGDQNVATITQDGTGNRAGEDAAPLTQDGLGNVLTIDQSGADNEIGLETQADAAAIIALTAPAAWTEGLYQLNQNDIAVNTGTITQDGDRNSVGALLQASIPGATGEDGTNTATIAQTGDDNAVNSVLQAAYTDQDNVLGVTISGDANTIAKISQTNAGHPGAGRTNTLQLEIDGDGNGAAPFDAGSMAGTSTATASHLVQGDVANTAMDSFASLDITGDNNRFGVSQYGAYNTTGTLEITGDNNQIGTYQESMYQGELGTAGNTITMQPLFGEDNDIGIRQDGDLNMASVNLGGDWNEALIDQVGDGHSADLVVAGSFNVSSIAQTSSGNIASVSQLGDNNTATVSQN